MDNMLEVEVTDLQQVIADQAMELSNIRIENAVLKRIITEMDKDNKEESTEE